MCQHRYYYEGYRTYGENIPPRAYGDFFPGDEPGWKCGVYEEYCGDGYCDDCEENTEREKEDEYFATAV